MNKISVIARREYQAMVATKAFLIGLAMMPVLMGGGILLPGLLKGIEKPKDRRIAVIDGTGQLFPMIKLAAEQRNGMLDSAASQNEPVESENPSESEPNADAPARQTEDDQKKQAKKSLGLEDINTYLLEEIPFDGFDDAKRLELSDKIRNDELYAFVEIPPV
jgi:ABC-2 type transport system permease protein